MDIGREGVEVGIGFDRVRGGGIYGLVAAAIDVGERHGAGRGLFVNGDEDFAADIAADIVAAEDVGDGAAVDLHAGGVYHVGAAAAAIDGLDAVAAIDSHVGGLDGGLVAAAIELLDAEGGGSAVVGVGRGMGCDDGSAVVGGLVAAAKDHGDAVAGRGLFVAHAFP